MILLLLVLFAASSFAAHLITTWPDNKKAACPCFVRYFSEKDASREANRSL